MGSDIQLGSWLEVATEAAQAGGSVLRQYWGRLEEVREKGRPGDLVTDADRHGEAAILQVLRRYAPDHDILAEESGLLGRQQSPFLWAIDPLDGTTNYAHQYPWFAVSIGLLVEGVPQLGVVYNPVSDHLFQAAAGLGATCNHQPIKVSITDNLAHSLLATGFAYDRRETNDNNYPEFCRFTHLTQGVRRCGAAALDLAYVAYGAIDGYWERGLSPWDIAAGIVLVREAGGQTSAYDGTPVILSSGRILATNGHLHQAMSQVLQAMPAPQPLPFLQ